VTKPLIGIISLKFDQFVYIMKNIPFIILSLLSVLLIHSCSAIKVSNIKSTDLEIINLGMKKAVVTSILGPKYTISKKKKENGKIVEVISYRNYPYYENEHYHFRFEDGNLTEWHREFVPNLLQEKIVKKDI